MLGHREGDFPVTERVARSTLALPWSTRMGELEVGRVADALRLAVHRR
jgi:perosamine synthetase